MRILSASTSVNSAHTFKHYVMRHVQLLLAREAALIWKACRVTLIQR